MCSTRAVSGPNPKTFENLEMIGNDIRVASSVRVIIKKVLLFWLQEMVFYQAKSERPFKKKFRLKY
jgi:hypothetical protein